MTSRWPPLTPDVLRRALMEEPPAGLADLAIDDLMVAVARTPQRGAARLAWPWTPATPGLASAAAPRRNGLTLLVVFAILLTLVALAAVAGAVLRPRTLLGTPGLIAFDSAGDIFVADRDGSGARQLTSDTRSDVQPTFSPDGSKLAFESLDPATRTVRLIVMDPDGTDRREIATVPAVGRASGPAIGWLRVAWSPDGRQLAYTAPLAGAQQIVLVNVDGSDPHQVGDPTLEGRDASWSPDGQLLAFIGGRFDVDRGIFVMRPDGTGIRPIRPAGLDQWARDFSAPVWAPTGQRLAFSARIDDVARIFVADLFGAGPIDLSGSEVADEWSPVWAPDGNRLAWHRGPTNTEGRFVVAAPDGSGVSVLAPAVVGPPTWSPDGAMLIGYGLDRATGSRDRLIVIAVPGGSAFEIGAEPGGDASWQRLAP